MGFLGLIFQNFTTVDFTVTQEARRTPPTALERAILKADKDYSVRKKKLGVDDRQIHKTYLKRERKPSAVGDIPLSEVEKLKKSKKLKRRPSSLQKDQEKPFEKPKASSSAQLRKITDSKLSLSCSKRLR